MRWLLAFLVPPLAVLACRKPGQAILNVGLCFMFFWPAIVHALCICILDLSKSPDPQPRT